MAKAPQIKRKPEMSAKEYMAERKALTAVFDAYKSKLDKKFNALIDKYTSDHCEWKVGDVLCTDKVKKRGYTRFVVFIVDVIHFGGNPLVRVGGWWINDTTNACEKWEAYVVNGVSNPVVFTKSANQKYKNPKV